MKLILIAAMARNRIIGKNNQIPWHIPEEMSFFKKSTMGHGVIMGRKTYESINKPLAGRFNVVLSENQSLCIPGCNTAHSLKNAIQQCQTQKKVFIIGGKTVYETAMQLVDTIILTIIDTEYDGDTYFPHIPMQFFHQSSQKHIAGRTDSFTIYTYQRTEICP